MAALALDLSSASSLASTLSVSHQVLSTKHFTASSQCLLLPWREKRRFFSLRTSQQQQQFLRQAVVCRAKYSVTLITPKGEESLSMPDDEYILDAAEDHGVALPYSCRSGGCSSCAAVLKEGKVDQSNQTYLEDSQVEAGYVLTCVAYPLSDIVLETHRESGLY